MITFQSRANEIDPYSLCYQKLRMMYEERKFYSVMSNPEKDDEDRYKAEKDLGKVYEEFMKIFNRNKE